MCAFRIGFRQALIYMVRICLVISLKVQQCKVVIGLEVIRLQPRGVFKIPECLVNHFFGRIGNPKIVVCFCIVRLEPQSHLVVLYTLIELSSGHVGNTEIIMRISVSRVYAKTTAAK